MFEDQVKVPSLSYSKTQSSYNAQPIGYIIFKYWNTDSKYTILYKTFRQSEQLLETW